MVHTLDLISNAQKAKLSYYLIIEFDKTSISWSLRTPPPLPHAIKVMHGLNYKRYMRKTFGKYNQLIYFCVKVAPK